MFLSHHAQRGLSLIELMIAMLIGCFLILGVTQIFIDNKRNYLFQQSQAANQENSRFTLLVLDQELAKTGYRHVPSTSFNRAFPAIAASKECPAFSAGQTVKLSGDNGICLRYQPRYPGDTDCLGEKAGNVPATPYTNVDPITEKLALNDSGELVCSRNSKSAVLVKGIADIRFELGTGPETERVIKDYTTKPANGTAIRSVRYKALMASEQARMRTDDSSKVLDDWKALLTKAEQNSLAKTDQGRLYQIAIGNITLRNLMP
ncbi:PilW family protein [Pseudomonas indica]|uniref:Type IV pilus assembly protein PilW n=1 Tax=Pseudomonas indica TaxID=137658 RepID=A0A1G9ADV7_9PSED|nr:prepilin-type N-terminal cleavage/methylation domain-containing protein [Pseudomonas indica]MBU3056168.1 prepilin-type N-terminal cleavage/methylation domain-containing protein [Pseudomonas indica]SDK24705.1 type IV pilus assembly protein PilW [Pseudomonas indica]